MATVWDSRFNNHSLWPLLDQIKGAIEPLEAPDDVELLDSLSRIAWLLEILVAHKSTDDTRGYTPNMLDSVQRALESNVWVHVQQYASDPDGYAPSLRTAADQVDGVLDSMGTWPALQGKGAAIAAGQAFASYDKAVKSALQKVRKAKNDLEQQVGTIAQTVESEKTALENARTAFEASAEEDIGKKITEVETRLLEETKESVDEITARNESAGESLQELENMEARGRGLLEKIANRAVAKSYQRNARNKSIAGWVWDGVGLLIGGTSLTLLLVHLFDTDTKQVETSLALTRLAVSIAGLGLAFLCFRRGAGNHAESQRSKRVDIRLSTVEAFVADQDDEFRDALIEGMADRIYLQDIVDSTEDSEPGLFQGYLDRMRERRSTSADQDE